MLYLVATPMGNLKDITLRALEVLQSVDLILCEDTRHSLHLLNHYNIQKPLKSYHKFNEKKELDQLIDLLRSGKQIALISDAGTPCIQDPGALLVQACLENAIPVQAIPGANAFAATISLSGEEEGPFQFIGFFPKTASLLKQSLLSAFAYEGHTLAYVSPHELIVVLKAIVELDPDRPLFIARELTKHYETLYKEKASHLLDQFTETPPKGEFVMMILKKEEKESFEQLSIAEHVLQLEKTFNISKNEAIKLAAKQRGLSKRDVYNSLLSS